MPKWLTDIVQNIGNGWGNLSAVRKIAIVGIVFVVLAAVVLLALFSAGPSQVAILNMAITDDQMIGRISSALDAEDVPYTRGADNRFYAANEETSRRARSILVREDLLPGKLDPWNFFTGMDRWTVTDFDRDVNLQKAITRNLEQHISSLDDVDSASVTLVVPETTLFAEDQNPTTASVVIRPKPGSDILENRKKIEGIVKLIQFAVEGLQAENITIVDSRGNVLNDFDGLDDVDRLNLTKKMLRQKKALEAQYTASILKSLNGVFSPSRVNIVKFDIDLSFVKKAIDTEEHFPVTMTEDNPDTPFSEREVVPSIIRSQEDTNTNFQGTGFNPEGPPGQEGQTPPAYQDLTNLVGNYESKKNIRNYEVNVRKTSEEKSPYEIKRISLGVVIDGTWDLKYDENGLPVVTPDGGRERTYTPVPPEIIRQAKEVVEGAVGYSSSRGDVVTIENIPFDRTSQFLLEDDVWRRQAQNQRIIFWSIIAFVAVVLLFLLARFVSTQREIRRREREEELARQHQAMREAALRRAEEESLDVEMSLQDRARMEMQDHVKSMVQQNPQDVAHLIRAWLMEN